MSDHRIPAIDRAVEILDELASTATPTPIRQLSSRTKLARSTVYRTLNTLEAHGFVRREGEAGYVLGARILKLARAVPQGVDLVVIARPVIEALAASLGASAKLSIVDGDEALVVFVAESPGVYSITTQIGRRFPLHAGAASKMLLACLPEPRRKTFLASRLDALTPRTITDPRKLLAMLDEMRSQGFAEDTGEYVEGVRAFAAPVKDEAGDCIAAVSVPFVDTADKARAEQVRAAVVRAATDISKEVGHERR